ncbi:hypothetical protein FJ251_07270 [bacterium]|nr:hypothetical protein [bacterium]
MIRRAEAYCLAPQADGYWALALSHGEGQSYRVNWLESLPGGRPATAPHWRELCRGGRRLLLLLPNDSCQLLHARLPEMKPELTRIALAGLLQKQRGGSPEQWSIDARRREAAKSADGRWAITGLAFERAALPKLLAPLAGSDCRPALALPQALALDTLLRRELRAADPAPGAWNLVYLGREERFLAIGDAVGPLLVRALPADLSGGADRAEYLERLVTEIERSHFFAQQGEQGARVQRVLVCGDPELAESLALRLARTEGLVAEHWQPEERFRIEGAAASWEFLPALAGAAVALDPAGAVFNILPRRREDGALWRLRRYAITGGASLCLGVLPLVGGGSELTRHLQARVLAEQGQQLAQSRQAAEAAARDYLEQLALLARQEQLDRYAPERTPLGPLLRDIAARLPSPVQLTDLDLVRDPEGAYRLVIRGESRGRTGEAAQAAFLQLQAALAQTPLLEGATEPSLEIEGDEDDRGRASRVRFELRYRLATGVKG